MMGPLRPPMTSAVAADIANSSSFRWLVRSKPPPNASRSLARPPLERRIYSDHRQASPPVPEARSAGAPGSRRRCVPDRRAWQRSVRNPQSPRPLRTHAPDTSHTDTESIGRGPPSPKSHAFGSKRWAALIGALGHRHQAPRGGTASDPSTQVSHGLPAVEQPVLPLPRRIDRGPNYSSIRISVGMTAPRHPSSLGSVVGNPAAPEPKARLAPTRLHPNRPPTPRARPRRDAVGAPPLRIDPSNHAGLSVHRVRPTATSKASPAPVPLGQRRIHCVDRPAGHARPVGSVNRQKDPRATVDAALDDTSAGAQPEPGTLLSAQRADTLGLPARDLIDRGAEQRDLDSKVRERCHARNIASSRTSGPRPRFDRRCPRTPTRSVSGACPRTPARGAVESQPAFSARAGGDEQDREQDEQAGEGPLVRTTRR